MGAARRHRKAQALPVRGGGVEVLDDDHGVVDSNDVFQRHVLNTLQWIRRVNYRRMQGCRKRTVSVRLRGAMHD